MDPPGKGGGWDINYGMWAVGFWGFFLSPEPVIEKLGAPPGRAFLDSDEGKLTILNRGIEEYEWRFLKRIFRAGMKARWRERDEAITACARSFTERDRGARNRGGSVDTPRVVRFHGPRRLEAGGQSAARKILGKAERVIMLANTA